MHKYARHLARDYADTRVSCQNRRVCERRVLKREANVLRRQEARRICRVH